MRRTALLLLIPLLGLASPAHAADGEVTVVGALDFAFKDLVLEPPQGAGFATTLVTLNPGVAIAYRRFYANVNFDKSIDSTSTTQLEDGHPQMLTMSRSDTVLTVGYRLLDAVSLFAGWLSGERFEGTPVFYTQEISYTEKGPFAGIAFSHGFSARARSRSQWPMRC